MNFDQLREEVARINKSSNKDDRSTESRIPQEIIEQTFNGKDEEEPENGGRESDSGQSEDGENAFAVLHRKAAQFRREPDPRKRKAKAVRCLVGRGFSYEDAINAADRWMREEGGGVDEE